MTTLKRELCLLVIEKRRTPLLAVVAGSAVGRPGAKLRSVWILVALTALRRGLAEGDMKHRSLHVWRPVAIDTSNRPVRPNKGKVGARMVEERQVGPLFGGVASFAS